MDNQPCQTNPNSEPIDNDIDYEAMLNKYGPEGLYVIADKLIKMANNDVAEALKWAQQYHKENNT